MQELHIGQEMQLERFRHAYENEGLAAQVWEPEQHAPAVEETVSTNFQSFLWGAGCMGFCIACYVGAFKFGEWISDMVGVVW